MAALHDLHPADLALFGEGLDLADDGRSGRFVLGPGLTRHDGALYGGTGLAASVLAMQAASGRDVIWCSTQFVSSPQAGAVIEWSVDVLAQGKRASQLLVRATAGGQVAFTALGSAGVGSDDGLTGQYVDAPDAGRPEDAAPWSPLTTALSAESWSKVIDLRDAPPIDGHPARSALWAGRRDGLPYTPVGIAFAADFVPLGVARSAGKLGAGSSLDNSMRFRPGSTYGEHGWVVLELQGDFASGGYGHGTVVVWSPAGELLATGSQSAAMRYLFDPEDAAKFPGIPVPPT